LLWALDSWYRAVPSVYPPHCILRRRPAELTRRSAAGSDSFGRNPPHQLCVGALICLPAGGGSPTSNPLGFKKREENHFLLKNDMAVIAKFPPPLMGGVRGRVKQITHPSF